MTTATKRLYEMSDVQLVRLSAAPSTAQSADIIINGGNINVRSLNGAGGVTGILGNEVEYFDDGDDISAYGLTTSELYDGNPLWIQHGTQSGQRIHVYINSMRTEALRGTIPNKSDKAQFDALDYDSVKQAELQAILNAAKNMTLDDAKVTTVENAKIAIRVVDGALEYALNEATTQGAYLQRLEFTDSNVTIIEPSDVSGGFGEHQ